MKLQRGSATQPMFLVGDIVYSANKYRETDGNKGKKKKTEKVASYKQRFKDGFSKYLQETEGASEQRAGEIVEQIWTIIENAANYMF